ncbi:hypothetical protein B0T13DRAFT_455515 [Neurospora crassa]|nr:hypothetical protein B0T13DRAFT_455515 [Neurospora crassa]
MSVSIATNSTAAIVIVDGTVATLLNSFLINYTMALSLLVGLLILRYIVYLLSSSLYIKGLSLKILNQFTSCGFFLVLRLVV